MKPTKDVTKVTETQGERHGIAANGQPYIVPTTTIRAIAADGSVVRSRTIDGTHPQTLANVRETMARAVQSAGFSWLGRSEKSESEKRDKLLEKRDAAKTPAEKKVIAGILYGHTPQPSTY